MPPKAKASLFDIQHAALGIQMFVQDRTLADYEMDLMLRLAVERQFEIIGEAMTRLRAEAPELLDQISEYKQIIGIRNVLIHGYDAIKSEITWGIIQEKLPILRHEIEQLLK